MFQLFKKLLRILLLSMLGVYKDESTDTERVTLLGTVQYLLNIMMYSIKTYIHSGK